MKSPSKSTPCRLLSSSALLGLALLLPSCAELGPTGNVALVGGLASAAVAAGGDHHGAAAIAQGTLNAINVYNAGYTPPAASYDPPAYQSEGDNSSDYYPANDAAAEYLPDAAIAE